MSDTPGPMNWHGPVVGTGYENLAGTGWGRVAPAVVVGSAAELDDWAAAAVDGARFYDEDTRTEYVKMGGSVHVAGPRGVLAVCDPTSVASLGDFDVFESKQVPELVTAEIECSGRPLVVTLGAVRVTVATGDPATASVAIQYRLNGAGTWHAPLVVQPVSSTSTVAYFAPQVVPIPRTGIGTAPSAGDTIEVAVNIAMLGGGTGVTISTNPPALPTLIVQEG